MTDRPDLAALAARAADLLARRQEVEALGCFRELCAREPHQPEWLLRLGQLSARAGLIEEAVGALGRSALGYQKQGCVEEALAACDQALQLSPPGAWQSALERLQRSLLASGTAAAAQAAVELAQRSGQALPHRESYVRRLDVLSEMPLLSGLPPALLGSLLSALEVRALPAGTLLVREGEPGDSMFLITAGLVQVSRHRRRFGHFGGSSGPVGTVLAELGPGTFVGEMALFTPEPRSATVLCLEPSEVLVMTREQAYALAERFPDLLEHARSAMIDRLVSSVLRTSPLFGTLPSVDRQELVAAFELRKVEQGEEPVVEGEVVGALEVVLTGELEVAQIGRATPIPHLSMGDVFGELSMLGEGPATATVRALRTSWTLALPRARFSAVMAARPVLETFLRRLGESRRAADLPLDAMGALSVSWF